MDVLNEIIEWTEGNEKVLWLRGLAGAGKSAIAQTVAERCAEGGKLVASFFFLRGDPKRSHSKRFCATLAAQLYSLIPEIRSSIQLVIENNPLILAQSHDIQFGKLVVEPLRALAGAKDIIIIIDGLDECQDPRAQNEILLLIGSTFRTPSSSPARFLVASRPEPNIRKTFEHASLRQITRRIVLDDSYNPERDIRTFLLAGFAEIHENCEIMASVPTPWPSRGILDLLVQRSSGQFIYASTVLKFVGDENFPPVGRLDAVINASDRRALSELDDLYLQILSTSHPDNAGLFRRILGMILVARSPTCELLDILLGLESGHTRLMLRGLHSLLSIPDFPSNPKYPFNPSYPSIVILHKSFSDFLQDHSRSGGFFVDVAVYYAWFVEIGLEVK